MMYNFIEAVLSVLYWGIMIVGGLCFVYIAFMGIFG